MSKKSIRNARRIMVIRHAEKPIGTYKGISVKGTPSPNSLTVKGWQRAGALVLLFVPIHKSNNNGQLSTPDYLYASPAGKESKSKRSVETILPLKKRLNLPVKKKFSREEYKAMANHAMKQTGTVLISWTHEYIPLIANHILSNKEAPQNWPGNRFDMIWIFELDSNTGEYKFSQMPQNILPSDEDSTIT